MKREGKQTGTACAKACCGEDTGAQCSHLSIHFLKSSLNTGLSKKAAGSNWAQSRFTGSEATKMRLSAWLKKPVLRHRYEQILTM